MTNPLYIYIYIYIYIYTRCIWFGTVGFYGISTKPNPLYTCILNIYDFFGWVLLYTNHWRLFNTKKPKAEVSPSNGLGSYPGYSLG